MTFELLGRSTGVKGQTVMLGDCSFLSDKFPQVVQDGF